MSERIVAANLAEVVKRNRDIQDDILQKVTSVRMNCNRMQVSSPNQLALQILKPYGLLQVPITNRYWSGAIFVKDGKKIPVINTALSRANQYFTAWHEIYHLMFDDVSFDHIIDSEIYMEERKADYFASQMLLGNLMPYYVELPDMDFLSKVFHCMDTFQVPYKAILISLYEAAEQVGNHAVINEIMRYFDMEFDDLSNRFRELGLDDSLVRPSYVVNCGNLQTKIAARIKNEPELNYNKDNAAYLRNLVSEMSLLAEDTNE